MPPWRHVARAVRLCAVTRSLAITLTHCVVAGRAAWLPRGNPRPFPATAAESQLHAGQAGGAAQISGARCSGCPPPILPHFTPLVAAG